MFYIELAYLFVCCLFWTRLHFRLRYTIICMCSFITLHHIKIQCFTVSTIVFNIFIFPSLFAFLFSTLNLNLFFSKVKYKAFIRLLLGLTCVLSTFSTIVGVYNVSFISPLSFLFPMCLSYINPAYITIIHVAIGVQWTKYFNAFFMLFPFLLYPPKVFDTLALLFCVYLARKWFLTILVICLLPYYLML